MVKALNIPRDQLAQFIAEDKSVSYMARFFGCSSVTIWRYIELHGLRPAFDSSKARRGCGGRPSDSGAVQPVPPCDPAPPAALRVAGKSARVSAPLAAPFWTPERDAAVIATQGKYSAIAKLAKKTGIAEARILGRWHQLRVAV